MFRLFVGVGFCKGLSLLDSSTGSLDSALDSVLPVSAAGGSVNAVETAVYANSDAAVYNDDNAYAAAVI